jgi:hypothetical protein
MIWIRRLIRLAALVAIALPGASAHAEAHSQSQEAAKSKEPMSSEDLAKLTQNPVANLISVPFQNNINFNQGDLDGTQNVLNIQPVIPISITKDWNVITRTILPVVTQPSTTTMSSVTGLGDLQFTAFLSPSEPQRNIV